MPENKQTAILRYIYEQQQQQGFAPTIREIGSHVGLSSSATVHGHINRLIKKGYLTRQQTKSRALKVTKSGVEKLSQINTINYVPLLEADSTLDQDSPTTDFLPFPKHLLDHQDDLFMIHQMNQTMTHIGIYPGDVLIVKSQNTALDGEIVVIDLPDAPKQVYRFFHEADHFRLQPENPQLTPVISRDPNILGKVISLYRPHIS